MTRWQLRKAKPQLSRLVKRACTAGLRLVTRKSSGDFKQFLTTGPSFEGLEFERSTDPARIVEL
jgi:hypothetical protein